MLTPTNLESLIGKFRLAWVADNPELCKDEYFKGGHCAEFSKALHLFLLTEQIDSEIHVMHRYEYCAETGKQIDHVVSHVFISVDGVDYDIDGVFDIAAWEIQTEENLELDWDTELKWDTVTVSVEELDELSGRFNFHYDEVSISDMAVRLVRASNVLS